MGLQSSVAYLVGSPACGCSLGCSVERMDARGSAERAEVGVSSLLDWTTPISVSLGKSFMDLMTKRRFDLDNSNARCTMSPFSQSL